MSIKSKILVVAPEAGERDAIAHSIGFERFEFIEADNPADALMRLDEPVELVICHLHLPSTGCVELLRRWQSKRPTTPFILVVDAGETAAAIEVMKHGAADYIVTPINGEELLVRIVKWLDTSRMEDRLHQLESQLDNHASQDDDGQIDIPAGTSLEDLERAAVEKALQQHQGNRTHAAKTLGISVRTLQRKLKAWRVPMLAAHHHGPSRDFSLPFAS